MVVDFSSSVFSSGPRIPSGARIVFVSDMFVDEYVGGAELTTQALIDSSPFEVHRVRSSDVSMDLLREGVDRFWIFGNFSRLNPDLIPSIVANMRYSIVEYDYKYCQARSPEKHMHAAGTPCDCAQRPHGNLVSAFYYGSMGLWWMSEAQKERYLTMFPFLAEKDNVVLSSVFDDRTLGLIKLLRSKQSAEPRNGWIVLGSSSWIKGTEDAQRWCTETGRDHEVVHDLPYDQLLDRLSRAEGFVYLPRGGDTCPRMVIEAKLLGCALHLNDHVQHRRELWFDTDDVDSIHEYLYAARSLFWNGIKRMMDYRPTISGYTTALNCMRGGYPLRQCLTSMLSFCDEVCVVDGGSTDATLDVLIDLAYPHATLQLIEDLKTWVHLSIAAGERYCELPDAWHGAHRDKRLRIRIVPRNWSAKCHPVFDGMQKAEARAMCTSEFCWQMDADEVVHEDDAPRIAELCRAIPREVNIMALPVIEYWGGPHKVRLDVQPWKWRLSRNLPSITHGIPKQLRRTAADGTPFAAEGTDGCDMIDASTGDVLPHVTFYTAQVEAARRAAMGGDAAALQQYQAWFDQVTRGLPCTFHYSWYDIPRKVRLYRDYWQNHWNALWGKDASDTAENNMMFGVPWSQVTDEMLEARARSMESILGGWVWHRPWDGITPTPSLKPGREQPGCMKEIVAC